MSIFITILVVKKKIASLYPCNNITCDIKHSRNDNLDIKDKITQ